jgi:hypothetical protein
MITLAEMIGTRKVELRRLTPAEEGLTRRKPDGAIAKR